MTLLERVARACRSAAWRAGWMRDRTRAAGNAVERLLDARGPTWMEKSGASGLTVVVRFSEGRTIRRGFGSAGVPGPMTTDVVFPVGSISKPVTAFTVLALVGEGLLSLDEPVWSRARTWEPPLERRNGHSLEGVTLRRTLSHGAGFDEVVYGREAPGRLLSARELLQIADGDDRHVRIGTEPGTTFCYSGAGYLVTQLLVEEATGSPFADVVQDRVFRPLGMTSSAYESTPAIAAKFVTGRDAEGRDVPLTVSVAAAPAGLLTSAEDLATFAAALLPGPKGEPAGRGIVSPALCREMLTSQIAHPLGDGWGLGLRVKDEASDVRFQHAGRDAGCFCQVFGFVRRGVVCVVFANADAAGDGVREASREIRHVLHRVPS